MTDNGHAPNQTAKKLKPWLILLAVLLVLIGAGLFAGIREFKKSFGFPRGPRLAFESQSPSGKGSAINVFTHYWDGPFVTLFVRDPGTNGGNPVLIAGLREGDEFEFLMWSGDGTIAAASMPVPASFWPPESAHSTNLLGFAYDFKTHRAISAPSKWVEVGNHTTRVDAPSAEEQDAFIRAAMAGRGGAGPPIRNMDRRTLEAREADQFGK